MKMFCLIFWEIVLVYFVSVYYVWAGKGNSDSTHTHAGDISLTYITGGVVFNW